MAFRKFRLTVGQMSGTAACIVAVMALVLTPGLGHAAAQVLTRPAPARGARPGSMKAVPRLVVGGKGFSFLKVQPTPRAKDALLPILVHLAARHVSGARDQNELDRAFSRAIAGHPALTDAVLKKLVSDFSAMPGDVAQRHFVTGNIGRAPYTAIAPAQAAQLLGLPGPPVPTPILRPWVDRLSPIAPAYGYAPGQHLTAVGGAFSPQASSNAVEIWVLDPDNNHKAYDVKVTGATASEVQFDLPASIAPGIYHLRVVVSGTKQSDFVMFTVNAPDMQIDNIAPALHEPSQGIIITGRNLVPGVAHAIAFTNIDGLTPAPPPVTVTATPLGGGSTQFQFPVPDTVWTGWHSVQVSLPGSTVHRPSNVVTYQVGVPGYRFRFKQMWCRDETDDSVFGTEWTNDEVYTLWLVLADGQPYADRAGPQSINETEKRPYPAADAVVGSSPSGGWLDVKYHLVLVTSLVETDSGDAATAQDIINGLTTAGSAIVSMLGGGPIAGGAVKAAGELAKKIVDWVCSDLQIGAGALTNSWTAQELQMKLKPQQSLGMSLDFHGDDEHGWYYVDYQVERR